MFFLHVYVVALSLFLFFVTSALLGWFYSQHFVLSFFDNDFSCAMFDAVRCHDIVRLAFETVLVSHVPVIRENVWYLDWQNVRGGGA